MATHYLSIKILHILCVVLSGGLFALRGILVLAGSQRGNHVVLRWLSYLIDTTLLVSALLLVVILHQYPFVHSWLTVKVCLLVVYIVLGVFALRRAPTRTSKAIAFAAALAVYLAIISVARAHHPLGILA
ncbi:SirB2 family protein [Dokdonella sp.]|uniref:SirB2 family protein n=1 Tax=Dokdonella sp. TaxID=2291710 RepID=UPI0025B96F05|nr:SirB2 family protein [Dokdonella sp.]MBX3690600.1 SirB2 family protein [Dokdonella sp.]MCW5568746.1 SirB2 family protein [Dokdonella sp.]